MSQKTRRNTLLSCPHLRQILTDFENYFSVLRQTWQKICNKKIIITSFHHTSKMSLYYLYYVSAVN